MSLCLSPEFAPAAHLDLTPNPGTGRFLQTVKGSYWTFQLSDSEGHFCVIYGLEKINPNVEIIGGLGYVRQELTMDNPGTFTIQGTCTTLEVDTTIVHVSDITGVTWNVAVTPLDGNPNPGGGKRIFPEWRVDYWDPEPDDIVAWVWPTATIWPPPTDPTQPVKVIMEVFDVDDPSANTAPVDDETEQTDNRGGGVFVMTNPPAPWMWMQSDTNGSAGNAFRVSLNPGDNYRALAGFSPNEVTGYYAKQNDGELARLLDAGGNPPPANRYTQDLLTVWRRLHVERDSMEDIPEGYNRSIGYVITSLAGIIEFLWIGGDYVTVPDRFVTGILRVFSPTAQYDILTNGASSRFFVTFHPPDFITAGADVFLYDDDFDLDGSPPFSRELLPELPDIGEAQGVFTEAYIDVVDGNPGGWNDDDVEPRVYLPVTADSISLLDANRDCIGMGRDYFWIGYVLSSFQLSQEASNDPDMEPPPAVPLGATYFDPSCHGAAIYLETLRDRYPGGQVSKGRIAAHELAHQFGTGHVLWSTYVRQVYSSTSFKVAGQLLAEYGFLIETDPDGDEGSTVRMSATDIGGIASWRAKSTLASYENLPQENNCMVNTVTPVDPQVGETVWIESKSLMAPDGAGSEFCPRYLHILRSKTASPLN